MIGIKINIFYFWGIQSATNFILECFLYWLTKFPGASAPRKGVCRTQSAAGARSWGPGGATGRGGESAGGEGADSAGSEGGGGEAATEGGNLGENNEIVDWKLWD